MVTYTYDCGNGKTATFKLDARTKYTVTVQGGLYGLLGMSGLPCGKDGIWGTYAEGDNVDLHIGARDGYTLEGLDLEGITEDQLMWTAEDHDVPERTASFDMPANDVAVTVKWKKNGDTPDTTYTVTFDANGGTLTGWTTTETEADGTVDYLAAATREGYTFDGWYTAADGGEKVYTYVNVFTADTTVYAHWTPEAETKQITEASFALKGYTVGANAKDIVVTSHTEGLSLAGGYFEALGKPYSYLIAVVDGNDYSPVNGQLEAGEEYVLMLKADVNAGYDVGSGVTEDTVTLNGAITADDCSVLKEESTLGISFVLPVLTDGDTAPAKNTVTVNGSYATAAGAGEYEVGDLVTLAAGSRSGYTFSGWTSNDVIIPNAGSADTSFVMPAKAVTVTANWTYIVKPDDGSSSGGGSSTSKDTDKTPDGWVEEDGVWYYYSDDTAETGWQKIDDVWYYLDPKNGAMAEDGMQEIDGEIYYFRDWGGMASNAWYQDDEGSWYYFGGSGAMVRNQWVLSKGIWYYLGSDGVMLANQWLYWNDAWYYLSESGVMLADQWLYWNGAWYYLSESGAMLADQWVHWNGTWYYLGSDGAMLTDTVTSDGYYVNKDGVWVA